MTSQEWGAALGRLAAAFVQTPVFLRHHSLKMTPARARLLIMQKAINIRNRRDCWAALFSRCPELPVRQKILEHEYEELIEDEHSMDISILPCARRPPSACRLSRFSMPNRCRSRAPFVTLTCGISRATPGRRV